MAETANPLLSFRVTPQFMAKLKDYWRHQTELPRHTDVARQLLEECLDRRLNLPDRP